MQPRLEPMRDPSAKNALTLVSRENVPLDECVAKIRQLPDCGQDLIHDLINVRVVSTLIRSEARRHEPNRRRLVRSLNRAKLLQLIRNIQSVAALRLGCRRSVT